MTKQCPSRVRVFSPLGSGVTEKFRIERYFDSFWAASRRAMDLVDAGKVPGARHASRCRVAIYVGTSGWVYKGWRQHLYADAPTKQWLAIAAKTFGALEING